MLGAAPHVLHHAGPLAGAAIFAGVSGKLLFGMLGLIAAVPILRRLRQRTGSWRVPAAALGSMAAIFTFSSLVIGPALTDSDPENPSSPSQTRPLPDDHEVHHE